MCCELFRVKIRLCFLLRYLMLLLSLNPALAGMAWTKHQPWMQDHSTSQPVFEILPASGFTAIVGQTIILPCIVHNLGDKMVSWIRTRDLHILTSGIHTYTSDNRFEVVHSDGSDTWSLRIKKTKPSDSGKYECQVNTDPKMNNALLLAVTDGQLPMDQAPSGSVAVVHGPKQQYVRSGSTITFSCVVSRPTDRDDLFLSWSHGGRDITFQFNRGGISIDTYYKDKEIVSRLTVAKVRPEDAGSYTCGNVNVRPDTVTLVIIDGEHTEAMMGDSSGAPLHPAMFVLLVASYLLHILQ